MKDFSFCLPSRGVFAPVKLMLDAFERTTKNKDRLEVLIAIDEGKTDIIEQVNKQGYSFDIHFFERPITDDFVNDYFNWLANKSVGENVCPFNDDAWMRTQNWDEIMLNHIKSYGWSIYCLDTPDSARLRYGNNFPCFPIVSRRAINSLGFMVFPHIRMYPGDKLTFEIYKKIRRVIPIPDVIIEHNHVDEKDQTKSRMWRIFLEDMEKMKGPSTDLIRYINKLLFICTRERKNPSKIKRIINILKEKQNGEYNG
jgi:hypothetical protein